MANKWSIGYVMVLWATQEAGTPYCGTMELLYLSTSGSLGVYIVAHTQADRPVEAAKLFLSLAYLWS